MSRQFASTETIRAAYSANPPTVSGWYWMRWRKDGRCVWQTDMVKVDFSKDALCAVPQAADG